MKGRKGLGAMVDAVSPKLPYAREFIPSRHSSIIGTENFYINVFTRINLVMKNLKMVIDNQMGRWYITYIKIWL